MDVTLKNRITKLLWQQCAHQKNPWFDAASCGLEGYRERWDAWHRTQIELLRELYSVVFDGAEAHEALLQRAMDFIEGVG